MSYIPLLDLQLSNIILQHNCTDNMKSLQIEKLFGYHPLNLLTVFLHAQEVEAGGEGAGDGDVGEGDAICVGSMCLDQVKKNNLKITWNNFDGKIFTNIFDGLTRSFGQFNRFFMVN